MNDLPNIIPCPFCGRKPLWDFGMFETQETTKHFRLHCGNYCPTRPSTPYCIINYYPFKNKPKNAYEAMLAAITIWNTRAP